MEFQNWTLASNARWRLTADRRAVGAAVAGRVPERARHYSIEERPHSAQPHSTRAGATTRGRWRRSPSTTRPAIRWCSPHRTAEPQLRRGRLARRRATMDAAAAMGRTQRQARQAVRLLGVPHLFSGRLGRRRAPGRADDSAGHGDASARRHLHRRSGDPRPGALRSQGRFTPESRTGVIERLALGPWRRSQLGPCSSSDQGYCIGSWQRDRRIGLPAGKCWLGDPGTGIPLRSECCVSEGWATVRYNPI